MEECQQPDRRTTLLHLQWPPSMSRCRKCQSTATQKTQALGSVIQWFTCGNCRHAWCRVDGERADPSPRQSSPGTGSFPAN